MVITITPPEIMLMQVAFLCVGFLCYAALKPVWSELPWPVKIAFSWVALFYLSDVFVRCTIGWAVFWQPPTWQDRTITYLCNSHCKDWDGESWKNYKRTIGRAVCRILNIIQKLHCEDCTSNAR